MNSLKKLISNSLWPKFLIIFLIWLLYAFHLQHQVLEAGLSFPANYNILLESLWFAELLSFMSFMLLLLFLPKRRFTNVMIILIVMGVIAIAQVAFFIGVDSGNCYVHYPDRVLSCGTTWSQAILKAPYYHVFDSHDYSLESEAPKLFSYQIPFLIGIGATQLSIVLYKRNKHLSKHDS